MTKYELTVIITPSIEEEKRKKILEKISEWIKKGEGKIIEISEWGKRKLAYQIAKNKEGFYYFWDIELKGKETLEIIKKLNLEEGVLRYLLIRKK